MPLSTRVQDRAITGGNLEPVVIARIMDGVNVNADLQVGGADISDANPLPISDAGGSLTVDDGGGSLTVDQTTHDLLNANVNLQVGDADVGPANPVPVDITDDVPYVDAAAADVNEPAINTAAVVTYAIVPATRHFLSGIGWSYDANPTGGELRITDAGVTVFVWDITTGGPGFVPFTPPKRFGVGTAVVITLAAGGAAVTGIVSVLGHWTA